MTSGGWKTVSCLAMAIVCWAAPARALDLYTNDFEPDLPGPGRPMTFDFDFFGTDSGAGGTFTLAHEVTATGGVGGSQGYRVAFDGSTAVNYFFAGVGDFAVDADDTNRLAGGVPGSENPGRYRLSFDAKVTGSTNPTPFEVSVQAIDKDYETIHNVDLNNDGDMLDGAAPYRIAGLFPTLVNNGNYVHVSYTLDQGTKSADTGIPTIAFSNDLALQWVFTFNSGGFGFTNANSISLDNIKIEFIEAVPGDYNGNGAVDAADYVVWRELLNQAGTGLAADGSGPGLNGIPDGVVDQNDYNFWKANFGKPAGSAAGFVASVPEPATGLLLTLAGCVAAAQIFNRRRDCNPARNC